VAGRAAAIPRAGGPARAPLTGVLLVAVLPVAVLLAVGALGLAAGPAGAAIGAPSAAGVAGTAGVAAPAGATGACWSASHPQLAARISAGIAAVLRQRASAVGLAVSDAATGITCELAASRQFDSASIVKATILAALLHGDNAQPSARERAHATAMITESDNSAATDLWDDVGPAAMRQFLNLAKMTQTVPGPGGRWGLTQVTAHDQMTLLHLLTTPNGILSRAARSYELGLMAKVDPSQRWGISAGVPAGMTVELKNGWLPIGAPGWQINSIGCVSGKAGQAGTGQGTPASPAGQGEGREYCLVVLTEDNPSMAYGVATISEIARVVNTELNSPLATAALESPPASQPPTAPSASAAPSAQAPADALTTAGLTAAQVRSAGLGPMGLRAPAVPAAAARPGMLTRLRAGIAAGVVAVALFGAGALLQVKRARRLA
jgi:hypothetical protein